MYSIGTYTNLIFAKTWRLFIEFTPIRKENSKNEKCCELIMPVLLGDFNFISRSSSSAILDLDSDANFIINPFIFAFVLSKLTLWELPKKKKTTLHEP